MTHASTDIARYAQQVSALFADASTAEETYYSAIRDLLTHMLADRNLPFEVRAGTKQTRVGDSGLDRPDLVFYDGGDFATVFGEVKLPTAEIDAMALSTEQADQIGRYLAQTGIVLLTNAREFALLACKPSYARNPKHPVPPTDREIIGRVELWPSLTAMAKGNAPAATVVSDLADLVERAVVEFAGIADPASLARVLARLARRAKADLPETFDAVAPLLSDYRNALGLSFDDGEGIAFFRSTLIQTAYYGLFAGWTIWHRVNDGQPFVWSAMGEYLTIPFLGQLFYDFAHPARLAELRLKPHLDRAAAVLLRVDRVRFFDRFNYDSIAGGEDDIHEDAALTYFYEPFLEAFDPELRKELGVWYTPPEIVKYQVEKVEQILRQELGCSRGFSDPRIVVLDPCCGTGAYLLEVIRRIARDLRARGDEATLGAELLQAISTRVVGFEILTAPFVVAQLQLYWMLADLKIKPDPKRRPAIFLTNALTGWGAEEQVKLNFPELQKERELANKVKRGGKIIVILGNPPYNRFAGAAMAEEADLVDHYKGITRKRKTDAKGNTEFVQDGDSAIYSRFGVRKQTLDDLYIRFFRLAEKQIGERAEYGVVSYISNSSYLTGRSHPILRESVLTNFHELWIDNLNGDKYRTGKLIPVRIPGAGAADQSAFTTEHDPGGIQVGTCISTFIKTRSTPTSPDMAEVHYRDFWGRAEAKRRALRSSLTLEQWPADDREAAVDRPEGPRPYVRIFPTLARRWILAPGTLDASYEEWPSLSDLFPSRFQGVNPNRGLEGSVIDADREALVARMRDYYGKRRFEDIERLHPVLVEKRARYEPKKLREQLRRASSFKDDHVVPYLVFPLDQRWIYYEEAGKLLNERRPELWENLKGNEFLVAVPQPRRSSEGRPLLATTLFDLHVHDRGSVCFPRQVRILNIARANLADPVWAALVRVWKLKGALTDEAAKELASDLFRVALAMLHAPAYEEEHADAVKHDWARVPVPRSRKLLGQIAKLGGMMATLLDPAADASLALECILTKAELKALAVMEKLDGVLSADGEPVTVAYFGAAPGRWKARPFEPHEPARAAWGEGTGDLEINSSFRYRNVPAEVWGFEIGGYPVLKKWLGYRQANRRGDQPMTFDELKTFRDLVQRLSALAALRPELDAAYAEASADAFTREELGLAMGHVRLAAP